MPEEGFWCPRSAVTDWLEAAQCGGWEMDLGPLEEQALCELSLQFHHQYFE